MPATEAVNKQNVETRQGMGMSLGEGIAYRKPNEDQARRLDLLRSAQLTYANALEPLIGNGRTGQIARQEFETSCLWAFHAITADPINTG